MPFGELALEPIAPRLGDGRVFLLAEVDERVLSLALLKFLMSWFVRLDTERKPSNYTTRVNGVKFFRAGVCTLARARACARSPPQVRENMLYYQLLAPKMMSA